MSSYISKYFGSGQQPSEEQNEKPSSREENSEEIAESNAEPNVQPPSSRPDIRKLTFLSRLSTMHGRFWIALPVAVLTMLLISDFCYHYMQRSTLTWLFYLDYSKEYVTSFIIAHSLSEFIVGFLGFPAGVIADSYIGHYKCIMYGNFLCFVLAGSYFAVVALDVLNYVTARIILYTTPLFTLTRGIRMAYVVEQIRLPDHAYFLDTYSFLMVFVRNSARATSNVLYEVMRGLSDELFVVYVFLALLASFLNLVLVYISSKKAYHEPVHRGIGIKVFHCIGYCLYRKIRSLGKAKSVDEQNMLWTDHGEDKFDEPVRDACRTITKLPVVFIPLTFNAFMRGTLLVIWDFQQNFIMTGYSFVPIGMKEVYNYFSLLILPLVHYGMRPLLRTRRLFLSEIHFVSLGYFLTGLAVALTAILQVIIDSRDQLPDNTNELRINRPLHKTNVTPNDSSQMSIHYSAPYEIVNEHIMKPAKRRNLSHAISVENRPKLSVFNDDELFPNFLYAIYPQVVIAVIGDCFMMPSLIIFTYTNSPRELRATLLSFGFTSEAVGRGVLALLIGPLGITSDTHLLKIWTSVFFILYIVYLYFILKIKFSKEDIDGF